MADFVFRALVAGLSVAVVAGPLGCFVVWRRMAYFGDTLAHSALFGVALGLLLDIAPQAAVFAACGLLALALGLMEKNRSITTDTILGILAHSALAFGMVVLSFTDVQIDLLGYLFGDLLTVGLNDLFWITGSSALVLVLIAFLWRPLLVITLHEELAHVEGLNTGLFRLALMVLIALVVALSMKIIGVLLITALLIIPPAAARHFTLTPETMAAASSAIGCLAVCGGMAASFYWDTPTGPSIVACAALIFLLSLLRKT